MEFSVTWAISVVPFCPGPGSRRNHYKLPNDRKVAFSAKPVMPVPYSADRWQTLRVGAKKSMSSEYDDSIWELVPEGAREADPWLARRASDFAAGADDVLDLGCGDGLYLPSLAAHGARLHCADRSAVALERAVRRAPAATPHLIGADERLPLADNGVQRVWCCDTLEHVVDTQTVLSE
ncbi:MAG: class I SAM-dependent methyltransferase, partial [Thermoleophilia bacterium]|nr:class I SAM-dependent methyltransferase [Thermoleophilia bacterium]